ncbi:hypothetical protein VRU48_07685 [Pedobacter sp. KR3-3]|uniref:Uncharacterized protein n=1 Tax=Pedobacter albus TaxID=3113905 RepID=A0ABU7I681_9SPHI|nr:hypothetical protein [Pedobacter sp. KR3-3]MEE1944982.1 hypothetical protein [Pedobacter sp. KR3-3]
MKTKKQFALAFLLILGLSCSKDSDEQRKILNGVSSYQTNVSVKSLIERNVYLDVDLSKITLARLQAKKSIAQMREQEMELAKAKALVYRYYSHVKLVDGFYVSDLKTAKSINISEQLFDILQKGIAQINADIRGKRAKGIQIEVPPITRGYLDSLIAN